ncbi:MAG: Gfo/Idh/MocA family oxidoreductase [Verrucomicrobiales bacterium]|nr:Gfo/Idh/MocA family oxidoreductase [Verrucomicrobiales bacterium]
MNARMTRRTFLDSTITAALAAGAFPMIMPTRVLGMGEGSPNRRVQVAAIGVGPQGQGVMSGILAQPNARVMMVCDLMERHREQARERVNRHYGNRDCAVAMDFREVLARPDIDAVMIATPDHWHVPVALAAAQAGKDIYLEKPMGLSLAEDQRLRSAVQRRKRVFQFGTQQRSSREFQRAVEWVRNGRIGELRRIHVWAPASRPGGPTIEYPVLPGLDYDRWLGPAPATPYTDGKAADNPATGVWKTWWYNYDYALGFIAGWGVHPLDIALWGYPEMMRGDLTVEGTGVIPTTGAGNTAVAWDVEFQFAKGVTMRYRGTANEHPGRLAMHDLSDWSARYGSIEGHGTAFEGSEGWVEVHRGGVRTHPAALAEEGVDEKASFKARRSDSHQRDWIESILSRRPAVCSIEESVQADLLCHLSDIAVRLGRPLRFDPRREKFEKDTEANARLGLRPARAPWAMV